MIADAKKIITGIAGIAGVFVIGVVYIVYLTRENAKLTQENVRLQINEQQAQKTIETQKDVSNQAQKIIKKTTEAQKKIDETSKQEYTMQDYNATIDRQNKELKSSL